MGGPKIIIPITRDMKVAVGPAHAKIYMQSTCNELRKRRLRSQIRWMESESKGKRRLERRKNKTRCLRRGGYLKEKKPWMKQKRRKSMIFMLAMNGWVMEPPNLQIHFRCCWSARGQKSLMIETAKINMEKAKTQLATVRDKQRILSDSKKRTYWKSFTWSALQETQCFC